jgi:hypothetical protein
MAPLDEVQFQGTVAASPFRLKYGQTVDRQSAHEIISARLAAARELASQQLGGGGVAPTAPTVPGYPGTLTPAQQQREIARQAREQGREIARAEREAERARRAAAREARADARARQRAVETGVRTAGRVLTSRAGQAALRGIFGTLLGGGRR